MNYRLLVKNELLQEGDEWLDWETRSWLDIPKIRIGTLYKGNIITRRAFTPAQENTSLRAALQDCVDVLTGGAYSNCDTCCENSHCPEVINAQTLLKP